VVGGTGQGHTITAQVRVTAIDPATRTLTVHTAAGNDLQVVAGPAVRNFDNIHVGDDVVMRYTESLAIVLSAPNTKLPDNTITTAMGRAAPGQKPAAAASQRTIVTGLVVGVDLARNEVSVVDPQGGAVHVIEVRDPARQRNLAKVNVGDTLTVIYDEGLALSVEPAKKS
jgi:fructose-specific component phosphotransferase system IIB-like protein